MMALIPMLLSPLGRLGMTVAALLIFLGMFASDQRQRAVAKIEKASTHAVKKSNSAGDKSRSNAASGVLDPYVRND